MCVRIRYFYLKPISPLLSILPPFLPLLRIHLLFRHAPDTSQRAFNTALHRNTDGLDQMSPRNTLESNILSYINNG